MKKLYDITARMRKLPLSLFDYPCVDPSSAFLTRKKIHIVDDGTALAQKIVKSCIEKGAETDMVSGEGADILIINNLSIDTKIQTENSSGEIYFDILFHYIRPVREVLPYMLNKNRGNIVFILPAEALSPSTEYSAIASYTVAALVRGLAQEYAGRGIVINGIAIDEETDLNIAARWVVFLASGNARNIVGVVIVLQSPPPPPKYTDSKLSGLEMYPRIG
jgi:NAD(P)-dependent dehydrogenase (short-subunit alcohol dehydrogenase family)